MSNTNRILLGYTKRENHREPIFLYDFSWDCGWYWGGGYIGNKNMHSHFDGAFLETPDIRGHCLGNFVTPWTISPEYAQKNRVVLSNGCAVWEDLETFLDEPAFDAKTWWRIKDLFKQFYRLRDAAEVFQYGGHCTSDKRNPAEINPAVAGMINEHLKNIIIPEIRKITGLSK
jgi:hypothetical protein